MEAMFNVAVIVAHILALIPLGFLTFFDVKTLKVVINGKKDIDWTWKEWEKSVKDASVEFIAASLIISFIAVKFLEGQWQSLNILLIMVIVRIYFAPSLWRILYGPKKITLLNEK